MYVTGDGNLEALKVTIQSNPKWKETKQWISLIDKKGRTPLHIASLRGHSSTVRFILNELFRGVLDERLRIQYVNIVDNKGRTALYHAAASGHSYILKSLFQIGVDVETATNSNHCAPGSTAIMACAEKGHVDCFNFLLNNGADLLAKRIDGSDSLYLAAMNGRFGVVYSIVNTQQMRILCHDIIDKKTYRGRTPLCTAAFHGHLNVVKLLFEHGSKLNYQDIDEYTPLILASYEGHLTMVKWLLRNGADPLLADKFGETALRSSDICGHTEITKFIEKWQNIDFEEDDLRKESIVPEVEKPKEENFGMRAKSKLMIYKTQNRFAY